MLYKKYQTQKAFTLVELIVVITILAILGTIAFISLQGFAKGARESVRLNDIKTIEKTFSIHKTRGNKLPIPDNSIHISFSGTTLGYQGYVGTDVLSTIQQAGDFLDPLTENLYTYSINDTSSEFQLLAYFEESTQSQALFFDTAYASSIYDTLFPRVFSSSLGIITETDNSPIMDDPDISGGLDLASTLSDYKVFFKDNLFVTGSGESILSSKAVSNNSLSFIDSDLVFFYPFDDEQILDQSKNSFTGSLIGSGRFDGGQGNTSVLLNGSDSLIDLGFNSIIESLSDFSISVWTKLIPIDGPTRKNYHILGNTRGNLGGFFVRIELVSSIEPGRIHFRTDSPGIDSRTISLNGVYDTDNTWHNIIITKEGSIGKIYLDGIELGLIESDAMTDPASGHGFAIGHANNSILPLQNTFNGNIDDVRMYDRAISQDEVNVINYFELK